MQASITNNYSPEKNFDIIRDTKNSIEFSSNPGVKELRFLIYVKGVKMFNVTRYWASLTIILLTLGSHFEAHGDQLQRWLVRPALGNWIYFFHALVFITPDKLGNFYYGLVDTFFTLFERTFGTLTLFLIINISSEFTHLQMKK